MFRFTIVLFIVLITSSCSHSFNQTTQYVHLNQKSLLLSIYSYHSEFTTQKPIDQSSFDVVEYDQKNSIQCEEFIMPELPGRPTLRVLTIVERNSESEVIRALNEYIEDLIERTEVLEDIIQNEYQQYLMKCGSIPK